MLFGVFAGIILFFINIYLNMNIRSILRINNIMVLGTVFHYISDMFVFVIAKGTNKIEKINWK